MDQNITRLASVRNGLRLVALSLTFSGFAGPYWGGECYFERNLLALGKTPKRPEESATSRKFFVVSKDGQEIAETPKKGTVEGGNESEHTVAFSAS